MQRFEFAPTSAAMCAAQGAASMRSSMPCRPTFALSFMTLRRSVVVSFVVYALISGLLLLTCPAMPTVKVMAGRTKRDRQRYWEDRKSNVA